MTDPSKRPLNFPKWHIPYLEKHRILELFHEITRELIIQRPEDHVLFMKQILQNAAASRDVSRVILIGPPKVNRIGMAEEIAKITRQVVITSNDLRHILVKNDDLGPDLIAKAVTYLVRSQNVANSGWIVADCINTEEEARFLVKYGVLPTHVIHLIAPFMPNIDDILYCNVPENWPEYRRNLFALKEVFKKTLREVSLGSKPMTAVAQECVRVTKTRVPVKRVRPRVVIIGPRGSGRKTQAKLLASLMGLVYIDFEYILCQAWMSESELGVKLRQCKKEVCFHSELLSQIVNRRVLEDDCFKNGWVLTGYPYIATDFKFLDSMETPPNRVIIIDCDLNVCKDRIGHRQVNAYTGSATNLIPDQQDIAKATSLDEKGIFALPGTGSKLMLQHPKDQPNLIQAEHDFYCAHYGAIRKYCGETAMVVNGDQNERWVYECISAFLVGANPTGSVRKGFGIDIPEVCSCDCVNVPPRVTKTYMVNV